MALSTYSPSALTLTQVAQLIPTQYTKLVRTLAAEKSIFDKLGMIGGKGSPILRCHEFDNGKAPGNTVRIPLRKVLGAAGHSAVTWAAGVPTMGAISILKGNEQSIVFSQTPITLIYDRTAVATDKWKMQNLAVGITEEFAPALAEWVANYRDAMIFNALYVEPSAGFTVTGAMQDRQHAVVCGGAATGWSDLTANCNLTVALVRKIALVANLRAIPMLSGQSFYDGGLRGVLLTNAVAFTDLKNDPEYHSSMRFALERGKNNPLFTGEAINIDGTMVMVDTHDPAAYGMGSAAVGNAGAMVNASMLYQVADMGFDKCESIFIGGSALGWASAQEETLQTAKDDDYGLEKNLGVDFIYGCAKTTINNLGTNIAQTANRDYGTIYVLHSQTQVA